MIVLHALRWVMGTVRFSIRGAPEQFLNQCARSGISLWNIEKNETFTACIFAGGYRHLLPAARKTKCVLKVQERRGMPFRLAFLRRRKGLVAGAVLAFLLIQVLSLHVWSVEVSGNEGIPTEQIESVAAELGLKPGVWKKDVQAKLLQQQLMNAFPQASWLSVNTSGCLVQIELEELSEKPDLDTNKRACNILAKATGQILYMEVYAGTPEVKEGDAVVEGQLLLNAVVEDTYGRSTLKHAAGKIIAATKHTFTTQVEMQKEIVQETGHMVTRRSATLFGLRVPLELYRQAGRRLPAGSGAGAAQGDGFPIAHLVLIRRIGWKKRGGPCRSPRRRRWKRRARTSQFNRRNRSGTPRSRLRRRPLRSGMGCCTIAWMWSAKKISV